MNKEQRAKVKAVKETLQGKFQRSKYMDAMMKGFTDSINKEIHKRLAEVLNEEYNKQLIK